MELPDKVDLDGRLISEGEYFWCECIGEAKRIEGDKYRVLAKGDFGLAVIEVRLSLPIAP